jgi:hypothetical protein
LSRVCCLLSLRSYIDFVKDRADYHARILPHDHRNRSEKEKANQIWKSLRPRGSTKGDYSVSIYRLTDKQLMSLLNLDDLALLYLKTAHPAQTQLNNVTRQSVVPLAKKFNLHHVQEELRQEKLNKQLKAEMKNGIAVPYFESEWGIAYEQQKKSNEENKSARKSNSAGPICRSTV